MSPPSFKAKAVIMKSNDEKDLFAFRQVQGLTNKFEEEFDSIIRMVFEELKTLSLELASVSKKFLEFTGTEDIESVQITNKKLDVVKAISKESKSQVQGLG